MDELEFLTDIGPDWPVRFVLALARLSPLIFFLPGIGEQTVPVRVRAALLTILSLGVSAAPIDFGGSFEDTDFIELAWLVVREALTGAIFAVSLRLAVWALSIAGAVVAQSIGLSQLLGDFVQNETQMVFSIFFTWAGACVLFSLNFHALAVAHFINLYDHFPVGADVDIFYLDFVDLFSKVFSFAMFLSWPFVVMGLLYNISLGFLNRAIPQLMVVFVGAPFMVGAGLALLAVSLLVTLSIWRDRLPDFVVWM